MLNETAPYIPEIESRAMKLIHVSERFENRHEMPADVFDYETHYCLQALCRLGGMYLIGRLREDYEFCPGDWDFLNQHLERTDELRQKALETPRIYARLEPQGIVRAYHSYMWLDTDSRVWWHMMPFLVEVGSDRFVMDPDKKFSELRWVRKEDMPAYSRQGYFEYALSKTLGVDHLYVDDYTTVYDRQRGYYSFFPYRNP